MGPLGSKTLNNALGLPNLVRRNRWSKLNMMMMTFIEVKGHQRSNVVNYVLWQPNLVKRIMQVYNDDDLHGGQRSLEVKCSKICTLATKLGQKNPWCKFLMMMIFMEVKGHQRSNAVNYVLWLPNLVRRNPGASLWWWWWPSWWSKPQRSSEVKCGKLCTIVTKLGQKKHWCKFMMTMTFMKVKSHQRSNVVNFALWLPNLVRKWLWPSWRSKDKF